MLDHRKPFRAYRLNVLPYRTHTVVMLTCTDWLGRTESDRRELTWDLPLFANDLHLAGPRRALEMILRDLLDRLDPPVGATWAKPPGSPLGDDRGEQEMRLPLDWTT